MKYNVYAQPDTGEEFISESANLKEARMMATQHVATTRDPVEITYEDGEPKEWWQWSFKRMQIVNTGAEGSKDPEFSHKYGL